MGKSAKRLAAGMGVLAVLIMADAGRAQQTTAGAAPPAPAPKTWVDALTLKGDLRYRFETIDDSSKKDSDGNEYTRFRNRLRARLQAEAKIDAHLKAGIGFSTGQGDPISGNQTLADGFSKKDFRLDLAYADYSVWEDAPDELHVIAGKMKNPFMVYSDDLVFDPDLTPEGAALTGQLTGESVTLFAQGGAFWMQERASTSDTLLYAGQAAMKIEFAPEVSLTTGASVFAFDNAKGEDVLDWEAKSNAYGNSTTTGSISGSVTNKAWAADFTPVVYFSNLEVWLGRVPVNVFVQQLSNTGVDRFSDGQLYGISVGKAKRPRTFEVGYSYAKLEKDATVGFMTDSDRWGGGTDGRGHRIYARYQLTSALQLGATYLTGERVISDDKKTADYDRLQVDISAKF